MFGTTFNSKAVHFSLAIDRMKFRNSTNGEPNGACWAVGSGGSSPWQLKQVVNRSFWSGSNRAVQPNGFHQRLSTRGQQSVWLTLPTPKSSWLLVLYCLHPAPNFILFCKLFLLPEIPKPKLLWLLILQDSIQKASFLGSPFLAPDTYHPGLVLVFFTPLSPLLTS